MLLPKHNPLDRPSHLARVRQLECVVCWSPPPNEAAHLRMGLAGGMGQKPDDSLVLPLCHKCHTAQCHTAQHNGEGEVSFWRDALNTNKVLLTAVLRSYARSLYQDEMNA